MIEVESFLALAGEDLAAARALLRLPRHGAFHLQQAAEKLVKAVLAVEGIRGSTRQHRIGELASMLPVQHPWRSDFAALDVLTPYATTFRYPGDDGAPPPAPSPADMAVPADRVEALAPLVAAWCRARPAEPEPPS